jgi:O-antigen/teichoic acid export membrane protein
MTDSAQTPRTRPRLSADPAVVRDRIATVVWLVGVLAALVLAIGALLWAVRANKDNTLVSTVLSIAGAIDGPFWPIVNLHDATANHLVNWGLAAVFFVVVARIADWVIRPRRRGPGRHRGPTP